MGFRLGNSRLLRPGIQTTWTVEPEQSETLDTILYKTRIVYKTRIELTLRGRWSIFSKSTFKLFLIEGSDIYQLLVQLPGPGPPLRPPWIARV